ncbi:hypothetical protein HO173_011975 [Letharia columbiana]|uniref:Uncharacterized protein n=1 Tax=Letharia columbiana TaxID=112416 RepID=A0A8H6CQJ0_9LECA|nr:uncharacterized protein HO173_011975 [Letharia columbiana]KAF6227757.1 hypothetical protein HO173_011975 [Letharia columbiana]
MVMLLLQRQANVEARDASQQTALHVAASRGFPNGLKNDAYKPAILAAKSGNPEMVTLLLRQKAKFKGKDSDGWTALHSAAHHGQTLVIEQLADRKMPSKATTAQKETPLHLAVAAGHFGATDCLLRCKRESCVTSKDGRGEEPLHRASRAGSTDTVNLLFSHKANVNAENGFGWKPLHIAVDYGHAAIVQQWVNLGASIEEKMGSTEYNKVDTHFLVDKFDHDDIARFLLSKGAKVDSACGRGWRPLHLAALNASPATVDMLLQRNAYPLAVTDLARSRTPLGLARHRSQSKTLSGIVPSEADRLRVQELLHAAMASVPKRSQDHWKQMKIIAGKGPDDKTENLRAAAAAMKITGKGLALARHASIIDMKV